MEDRERSEERDSKETSRMPGSDGSRNATRAGKSPTDSSGALKRAIEESRRFAREATALLAAARTALSEPEPERAMRLLFHACRDHLGARWGYSALPKPDGRADDPFHWDFSAFPGARKPFPHPDVHSLHAEIYRTARPSFRNCLHPDDALPADAAACRNILLVPAVSDGKVAAIWGFSDKTGGFDENDVRAASRFMELALGVLVRGACTKSPKLPEAPPKAASRVDLVCREELALYQRWIDSVPIPIFHKDREGRYLACNKAFEVFHGRSRQEIVGRTVYDVATGEAADIYHRNDLELFENPGIQVYESTVEDARGKCCDVAFHKATFHLPDGTVAGLSGAMIDISARKQAEEQSEIYREHLEKLTERRTEQLLKANRELRSEIDDRKHAESRLREEYGFRAAVIERAAEGICVCRKIPGHPFVEFTLWNDRMTEITGRTMEEINREGPALLALPDTARRERNSGLGGGDPRKRRVAGGEAGNPPCRRRTAGP